MTLLDNEMLMLIFAVNYLSFALLFLAVDASFCLVHRKQFYLPGAIFLASCWWIASIHFVYKTHKQLKNTPDRW